MMRGVEVRKDFEQIPQGARGVNPVNIWENSSVGRENSVCQVLVQGAHMAYSERPGQCGWIE